MKGQVLFRQVLFRRGADSEHDAGSPSGPPDDTAFFPGGAPEQFEAGRQNHGSKNIQTGAAGRVIDDRAIDDRVARTDNDLARAGNLPAWPNPRKSARMRHMALLSVEAYLPHNLRSQIKNR